MIQHLNQHVHSLDLTRSPMSASKKVSATNPTTKESRKRKTDGENDHMDLPAADAVALCTVL